MGVQHSNRRGGRADQPVGAEHVNAPTPATHVD